MMVRLPHPEVRRQIKGQLQTAERLTAINRVTSGVAHEVKWNSSTACRWPGRCRWRRRWNTQGRFWTH
jgi:hypothetical protein